MNVLFVHDHIFIKSQDTVYSASAFPSNAWGRYLEHFNEVIVLGRLKKDSGSLDARYVKSSTKNVKFNFLKNRSTLTSLIKNIFIKDREIEKYVKNSDAIIVRLPSENGLRALLLAIKYDKPLAVEVVGCIWDGLWNYGSLKAKVYAPLMYYRMKKNIKKTNLVLYVTEHFLQNRYPGSLNFYTVSASNINIDKVDKNTLDNRKDHIKIMFHNKIIFGIIGNYKTKYKGIDIAIKALSTLEINWELRILGQGDQEEYKQLLEEKGCTDRVAFSGSLPNGQPIYDWIDEIHCYMQPSLTEGLPRALIEAMSRGCFCLASTAGGVPELLNQSFLHTPGDYKELQKHIQVYIKSNNIGFILNEMDRNFQFSTKYYKSIIEQKRSVFYKRLRSLCDESN